MDSAFCAKPSLVIHTPIPRESYARDCTICGKRFTTRYSRQMVCSFDCRQIATRENSLLSMRRKRAQRKSTLPSCEVCGFNEVIEQHHENGKRYFLCPNHHAIITRNKKSINELLNASS